jgi:hypothetical protein
MNPMFEAAQLDMPYLEAVPKREKSKVLKVWDTFQELRRLEQEEGMLIPVAYAAKVINVCRQRVDQLIADGRLSCHQVNGQRFVGGNSVEAYAKSERKAGRPFKRQVSKIPFVESPWAECVKMGKEAVQEAISGAK